MQFYYLQISKHEASSGYKMIIIEAGGMTNDLPTQEIDTCTSV